MAESVRMDRVARQVQMALADALTVGLKDPRYQPVTVTQVRVSPDLRCADIRFMPLAQQGDPNEICAALNSAAGFLQRKVSQRIRMKYMPRFRFHVDMESEEAMAMHDLLDRIKAERGEE